MSNAKTDDHTLSTTAAPAIDDGTDALDSVPASRLAISRRAALGSMAMAAVATACLPGGDDVAGPSTTDLTAPPKLPLVDSNLTTTTERRWGPPKTTPRETTTTVKRAVEDASQPAGNATTTPNRRTPTTQKTTTTQTPTTQPPATQAPATTQPATTQPPATQAPTTTQATTTTTEPPPPPMASTALLVGRLSFGMSGEIESDLMALGDSGWVAQQLAWNTPDPAAEAMLGDFRMLTASRQQMYAISREDNTPIWNELTHSVLMRAVYSRHQLFEMMVHLWMDHFNVNITDGTYRHLVVDYQENFIRPNAMGRFVDLLRATAESPAMLNYLNNDTSNANSSRGVNENYGRELLELHTLGIDPAGNQIYTEEDVVAASKVMSGWSIERDRNAGNFSDFRYRPDYHSSETVSLLGGQFSNAGTVGQNQGYALIDFLARHPTTARNIAYKIIRRFVTDTPSEALIASTAQVYLANDTGLVPTLQHVFDSADFANSTGLKMRRPFEIVAAGLRGLHSSLSGDPLSDAARTMRNRLRDLQQEPWMWEQPDGFPDHADPWLSSDGMLNRWAFTARLANDFHTNPDREDPILTDVARLRGTAATCGELVDNMLARLGVTADAMTLGPTLLGLLEVTDATPAADLDDNGVRELASYLLAHPSFQLR